MKNFKLIFFLTLIVSVFTVGCNDYLDERDGVFSTDGIDFNDPNGVILPAIGNYNILYTRRWEEYPLLAVRGDDVNSGGLGDQQPYTDTDHFIYDKNYWMYNSVWEGLYKDVTDINANIALLEKYKENQPNKATIIDQYIAESRFMVAWLHSQLTKNWGKIFIIETNKPSDGINNGLKTKEEVMQYVSNTMTDIMGKLPDMRPNQRTDIPGGITRYTALALKAQAELELKNYSAVADAAGQIISSGKFQLYDDFYQLFKKPGKLSDESLFELQYSDATNNSLNYCCWGFFGPVGWTPAVAGAGDGWGFFEPSMKYIKFMLARGEEVRLKTSVLFTNRGIDEINDDPNFATLPAWVSNTTPDGDKINDYARAKFASGKHYLPSVQLTSGQNGYGSGMNMPVIRYAEVLLMYAEALKQGATGTAGTAENAVNLVRTRAGMPALTSVTVDDVINEKYAELAMEWGTRYYDMVRLNRFNELSYDGRTFTEGKIFLPYPQAQVDVLPLD